MRGIWKSPPQLALWKKTGHILAAPSALEAPQGSVRSLIGWEKTGSSRLGVTTTRYCGEGGEWIGKPREDEQP